MRHRLQVLRALTSGIVLTLLLLTGCASLEAGSQADASSTLKIDDPWARSEMAGDNSAAYMLITNEGDSDDALVGASTAIAGTTEIHEAVDKNGVMKMREIESIGLGPGETVTLEPGGLHVMFFDLQQDLEIDDEFELTLQFESGAEIEVTVTVRENAMQRGHGG